MSAVDAPVSAPVFSERIARLLGPGGPGGLPRRALDRMIVLKCAALWLRARRPYSEKELNAALRAWLDGPAAALEIDHVSLRRELVDAGFLARTPAGERYEVTRPSHTSFAPEVDAVDVAAVLSQARAARHDRATRRQGSPDRGGAERGQSV